MARWADVRHRVVYTGIFADGSQIMVERWVDRYGREVGMTAAARPRAHPSETWGPPVILNREDGDNQEREEQ